MQYLELTAPTGTLKGEIFLPGSKSISNRLLIIQALAGVQVNFENLSISDDTLNLQKNLNGDHLIYDVHHAGTNARFLTAFFAFQSGDQIITGSQALKKRPIEQLVRALNSLGANIEFLEVQGNLPIKIMSPSKSIRNTVQIDGSISSQYISALALVAPTLPKGLTIEITNDLVSSPYLEMTLDVMKLHGIDLMYEYPTINIPNQTYCVEDAEIEGDWSAASYFYALCSLMPGTVLQINGLKEDSLQGDRNLVEIFGKLGVRSIFNEKGVEISSVEDHVNPPIFEYNFLSTPDLFQTVSVVTAIKDITSIYSGLNTLAAKETDRFNAMKTELQKTKVSLFPLPSKFAKKSNTTFYMQEGMSVIEPNELFLTYEDHRMAMACSLFSTINSIRIEDPSVVTKSFPSYWENLEKLGWKVT